MSHWSLGTPVIQFIVHKFKLLIHNIFCFCILRWSSLRLSLGQKWTQSVYKCCSRVYTHSDDGVEGVIEPLHRQLHHLSQGVVLGAVVLTAHRLVRGEEASEKDPKIIQHKYTVMCLSLIDWKILTLVSKQMWTVFPSTVTEMFLPSLKSTNSSPNMSLKTDRQTERGQRIYYSKPVKHTDPCLQHHKCKYTVDIKSLCITHCNMTSSRVWKTSMSIMALWVSMTVNETPIQSHSIRHHRTFSSNLVSDIRRNINKIQE